MGYRQANMWISRGYTPGSKTRHQVHERGENPLRHPPNQLLVHQVGWEGARAAAQGKGHLAAHAGLRESGEWQPEGALHFIARHKGRASSEREDERPYDHRREDRGTGVEIVQHPQPLRARQVHSRLLAGFPTRRGLEVQVAGAVPAARESDLTGPGVVGPLGAPDEQDLETMRAFQQDEGDRGGASVRRVDHLGAVVSQRPTDGSKADHTRCFASHCTIAAAARSTGMSPTTRPGTRTPAAARASAIEPSSRGSINAYLSASTSNTPRPSASSTISRPGAPGGAYDTTANPARASRSASPGLSGPHRTVTGRCPPPLVTSTATGDPVAPVRRNDRLAGVAKG